jgi:hypothetical protein
MQSLKVRKKYFALDDDEYKQFNILAMPSPSPSMTIPFLLKEII